VAARTGAALAGAMGVGRFVFTPVLPVMKAQAHLTSSGASTLATSNYLGYLVGALVGIAVPALPAMTPAVLAALASAVLFGGTFVGITTMSLATGRHLQVPQAVAILTAVYGIGQVLGPLVVIPTLHGGYRTALLVGAALVLAAAATSALLRIRFPHHGEAHHHNRNGLPDLFWHVENNGLAG
jgi:hypothetical protein